MTLAQMLADLPKPCDIGCKRNSKNSVEFWVGYKLHLDVADGGIPVSAILSSASVHDSQAALPLALQTSRRVALLHFLVPEDERFKERSGSERANARLKDEFGGRCVRVRGHAKVLPHLMFGILALTADQLLRLVA